MEVNAQSNKTLDEEFRDILRIIKPFILQVHDRKYLAAYRIWLEKLSGVGGQEAQLRNVYVTELCKQIQMGILEHPFETAPPEGPLMPFLESLSFDNEENSSWQNMSERTYTAMSGSTFCELGIGDSEHNLLNELSFVNDVLPLNKYQNKFSNVAGAIEKLKNEHSSLTFEVEECKKDLNLKNTKAETSIHKLTGEMNLLRSKVEGLFEAREIIKTGHINESEQLQNVICSLERKLHASILKNSNLKFHIASLQQKINELGTENRGNTNTERQNENLIKIHNAEITLLKQNHVKMITDLENTYAQQVKEKIALHSKQTQEQKNEFESKYVELKIEYEKTINEKDREIFKCKQIIKDQEERIEKEIEKVKMCKKCDENKDALVNKIRILQNCICRMHKLFKKSDKEYSKLVGKLKSDLELKERKHKIELSSQRAELVSKINLKRQTDIDEVVADLEKKYKTLLDKYYVQSLKEKEEFDANITNLQKRLEDVQSIECNKVN